MADQTYRVLANRHGNPRGPKSQYRTPTVADRAELAKLYVRTFDRMPAELRVGMANFLGFVCEFCGSPTPGTPSKQQICELCDRKRELIKELKKGGAA